ncbi:copper chaperone PCu(A)C [Fulvimarina sp. 2208YS6-2-32]|uniref:Copper chaperone PCu(A)C n=1 Tax=Fulvimarina uroteuthidis TaxID=3098149 RepID=A0ABU5I653_9HYPH|nr:copper chaperone PCu(A)C [Fulvimarina sp. 2208YS6-2-32]MDY8110289.1 copper chaperone PCu(A)C [Fulvimarina sp. 2208YS6-2-32]
MTSRLISLAGALLALSFAPGASAHDYTLGDLSIAHPWTRATLPNAPVAGAYLSIQNAGSQAVTLTGASTPAAESAEIHSMELIDGVMRMEKVEGGLTIEPGKSVTLEPGGYHVMMMGLAKPIEEGALIPMTLEFSDGKTLDVELQAEPVGVSRSGKTPPAGGMDGMDHGDGAEHGMDHGSKG